MLSLSIVYGILSGLIWGAGDFAGGLAAKKNSEFTVVVLAHLIGGLILIPIALIFNEPIPGLRDWLFGMAGGIFGAIALLAFYRAMADGPMGVVAPVTAVITSVIPVAVSLTLYGLPDSLTLIGILIAIPAVWLVSASGQQNSAFQLRSLWLPLVAGIGFSLFFVLIDQVSDGAIFWPLVGARAASVVVMGAIGLAQGKLHRPDSLNGVGIIVLAGLFDTAGNALFALSTQTGRLDIASVLSSLYPVSTLILARLLLSERFSRLQLVGILLALAAVVLIAI